MNPTEIEQNNYPMLPATTGSTQDLKKTQYSSIDISGSDSLSKVRDILFGGQMRELEKRFNRLEERLVRECTDLRDETRKRLDSLEIYVRQEIDSVTARLKNEQEKRDEEAQALLEEHKNLTLFLEKKLSQFNEHVADQQRDTREHILNQYKVLQDEIRLKYEELWSLLQRESQELRIEKTDRATLAALFTELAIRLNSQQ